MLMYNILVTDDEKIITDGLYELIKANMQSTANVYKAYSGKQALEICKTVPVDILLTDVRMPEIDGFELQRKIMEILPDCSVVFLSAYNDFDYMQHAIRGGSVDYIVKTEGDEAILAAIDKAVSIIRKKEKNTVLLEKANENMQKALPLLRKEFIIDILEGGKCSEEVLKLQFSELEILLDYSRPVLILIGRIGLHGDALEPLKRIKSIYGIQNIALDNFPSESISISIECEQDKLLWLLQPKNESPDSYENMSLSISSALVKIKESFEELFKGSVFFAFNPKPIVWKELSEKFYILKLSFGNNPKFNENAVFIQDSDEFSESDLEKFKIRQVYIVRTQIKKISRLELLLEGGQAEEFNRIFDSVADDIRLCRKISYSLLSEVYYALALMYISYINRFRIKEAVSEKTDIDLLLKMDNHSSWEGAVTYLKNMANIIFELEISDNRAEMNKIIFAVENYVAEHLESDVSLSTIADALHFNASYLSRVFKQITDKSLTEYITEIRIKKACSLLNNTDLKIYEIASMTGFESASYFNKFFKKHFTITPQEYREKRYD